MARTKKTKAHRRPKEALIPERSNPPAAEDDEGVDEDDADPPMPPPKWTQRRARKTVFKNFRSLAKGEEVVTHLFRNAEIFSSRSGGFVFPHLSYNAEMF